MKKIFRTSLALLTACLTAASAAFPALAADTPGKVDYAAFGDSVAAGVRGGAGALGSESGSDKGYTDLIAGMLRDVGILGSFSEDYCTSGMTAKQLAADTAPLLDPASDGAKLVSDAEIATVDIGANDLLGTLYAYVKSLQSPADADPAKVVRLLDQAVLDLYGPGGKQTQADIAAVLKNILAANGGVKLYVMGYYNPLPLISAFYGVDLKEPVKYLNGLIQEAISDASDAYPNAFITYVPTFEAMASSPDSLVVYDIHPTESGYETIANEFWKEITLLESYYISNAVPSVSPIVMGGSELPFTAYNINGNNYVKLRDVAMALSGSPKQFGVSYDDGAKSVGIRTGAAYVPYGGELCGTADKAACTAALSTCEFTINGVRARLTAYNVNGNNYVKLRDVGEALDFGVEYDHNTNTVTIDASKCYSPEA